MHVLIKWKIRNGNKSLVGFIKRAHEKENMRALKKINTSMSPLRLRSKYYISIYYISKQALLKIDTNAKSLASVSFIHFVHIVT